MKTKITELLGIEYPIVQGAMAWIAEHHLAAAVSKAGGLGIIAGGAAPVDYIRDEIHKARAITDKPLGMNIMLLSPNADDLAQLAIDEKIEVLTTGAGNPGKYMEGWKSAGIKVCRSSRRSRWPSAWRARARTRLSRKAWRAAATSAS